MTTIPTARIKCPVRKGVSHAPTFISGHCAFGPNHNTCRGQVVNGCGCVIPCRCTEPGHDYPHAYQEEPVLPSPFTVPDPRADEHPEAVVTPTDPAAVAAVAQNATKNEGTWDRPLGEAVAGWTERIEPRARPWVDGTGEPGTLEVMVRCFAMAAGDLHLHDDRYEAYDETALVAMLGILRASVRRAGELDALLVAHLHEHHAWGKRIIEGIGEVRTYRRPKNTKWDDYGTAYAVVDWHLEQREGELPDDLHEVVRWLLDAGAIDYYRTTALAAMGIDVSEYRHQEKGTRAVDVPVPD